MQDLESAFETGLALAALVEVLSQKGPIKGLSPRPRTRIHKVNNLFLVFEYEPTFKDWSLVALPVH